MTPPRPPSLDWQDYNLSEMPYSVRLVADPLNAKRVFAVYPGYILRTFEVRSDGTLILHEFNSDDLPTIEPDHQEVS